MAGPVNSILTVKALAARDAITPAAVSKFVKEHGVPAERDQRGRVVGIDVETWDRMRAASRDGAMARKPATQTTPPVPAGPAIGSLDEARLDKLRVDTRLAQMRADEEARRLLRRDLVDEAVSRLGEEIARCIELQGHTDRLARACGGDNLKALRAELKAIVHEIQSKIADTCARMSIEAPALDPMLHEEPEPV